MEDYIKAPSDALRHRLLTYWGLQGSDLDDAHMMLLGPTLCFPDARNIVLTSEDPNVIAGIIRNPDVQAIIRSLLSASLQLSRSTQVAPT